MKKIYNLSRNITSKAEFIEYEISGYNPGTSRTPLSVPDIKKKYVCLSGMIDGMLDKLDERKKDETF